MSHSVPPENVLDVISRAALLAGEQVLSLSDQQIAIEAKGAMDILTTADRLSQEVIISALAKAFPDIPVVAEEQEDPKIGSDTFFTVDPIDGTIPFTQGAETWAINCALIWKNSPYAGVTYQPATKRMAVAERGRGCLINGTVVKLKPSRQLKLSVVECDLYWALPKAVVLQKVVPLMEKALGLRSTLCCSAAILDLLQGKISALVHFEGTKIWDFAPGVLMLEEAGGFACDVHGKRLSWQQIPMQAVLAPDRELTEEILAVISSPSGAV